MLISAAAQTTAVPRISSRSSIVQSNNLDSLVDSTGGMNLKSVNWAVIVGNANSIAQSHIQKYFNQETVTIEDNSTSALVVIGSNNIVNQTSNPNSLGTKQINELLLIGNNSNAIQSNFAFNSTINGTTYQEQKNFAVMFGNNTGLNQTNVAYAWNNGTGNINQIESNTAYVYGDSIVNQFNSQYANATKNSTAYINQTSKNLAFAISDNITSTYIPIEDTVITMKPSMSNISMQAPSLPGIPELPSPPSYAFQFPADP